MSDHLDHDLSRRLDNAIGVAPTAGPTIDGLLVAGRRARTRRRFAQGSAALALVLMVGGGAVAAAGLGDSTAGPAPSVATEPPAPTPSDDAEATAAATRTPSPDEIATLGKQGLQPAEGVTLLEQVENPLAVKPPAQSVGVVAELDGVRYWLLLRHSPQGASGAAEEAGFSYSTFDLWLDDQVALQQGKPLLALVAFGEGETLVPAEDGVEVVEQRPSPPLPPGFSPSERSAVAEVTWHGEQWFVLATQPQGAPAYFLPVEASVAGETTIDGFLEFTQERYDRDLARERAESGDQG